MRSGIARYIATRAVASIITVLGAVILTFVLTHLLAPNPAHIWAGPHASASEIAAITKEYHLNLSLIHISSPRDLSTSRMPSSA